MYIHWAQLGVGGELPNSQDVRLGEVTSAADLLRRANREGCTLLLGTCLVDRVGPVVAAAVVEREGIAAVGIVRIVDGATVVVMIVVAIALTCVVVEVFVVVAIACHSL